MTIPTPPSTVQDVEGLIEEAAEASRFLRSPDSRGAWLKSNLLLMARVTEQLADALRSTTRQLEVAEEALREIFSIGCGFGPNTEDDPQGTTGEGHAEARQYARTALAQLASMGDGDA